MRVSFSVHSTMPLDDHIDHRESSTREEKYLDKRATGLEETPVEGATPPTGRKGQKLTPAGSVTLDSGRPERSLSVTLDPPGVSRRWVNDRLDAPPYA